MLALQHQAGPSERSGSEGLDNGTITGLIERCKAAKAVSDFATANSIRDLLNAQGIELIDRPGGSTEWLRR